MQVEVSLMKKCLVPCLKNDFISVFSMPLLVKDSWWLNDSSPWNWLQDLFNAKSWISFILSSNTALICNFMSSLSACFCLFDYKKEATFRVTRVLVCFDVFLTGLFNPNIRMIKNYHATFLFPSRGGGSYEFLTTSWFVWI